MSQATQSCWNHFWANPTPDSDKQLAYWLACRGNGTRIQVKQAGQKACSKRAAKQAGAGIKHARKKVFKWAFMTGGKTPPQRFKYGIP